MSWGERVLDLLFPPRCPFCGRVLDRPGICPKCEAALPWTGEADGLRQGPGDFRCAAALRYEGLAREGLLHYKFRSTGAAARTLGELAARCAAERFSGQFDTVTWVPVSRKRLRRRGFDQAELLCRSACRLWGVTPVRLLVKETDNPPQSGLREAAARRANVLGVYAPAPGADIAGRRVLLMDDICTTGATLRECARVLRQSGAADVVCAVVAAAGTDRGPKREKTGQDRVEIPRRSV